jgi:ABC-2 type transport system permease protein
VRLLLVHVQAETRNLRRYPAYVVPTLTFPSLLMLLYGFTTLTAPRQALMVSFAGFAVLAVSFFQFGVGIALERTSQWHLYMRTLPASSSLRLGARLVSALAVGAAAAGVVIVVALACGAPPLPPLEWFRLAVVLFAGSIPFALLGIGLGYSLPARGALPVANILYLVLSYLGGLWGTVHLLYGLDNVAGVLPTTAWGNLLRSVALGTPWQLRPWVILGIYTVLFGAFALVAYRHDEGERFY